MKEPDIRGESAKLLIFRHNNFKYGVSPPGAPRPGHTKTSNFENKVKHLSLWLNISAEGLMVSADGTNPHETSHIHAHGLLSSGSFLLGVYNHFWLHTGCSGHLHT